MKSRIFIYALLAIICLQMVLAAKKGSKNCKRKLQLVEEGRKCKKACRNRKDCGGKSKRCLCDDVCGKSCINKETVCPEPEEVINGRLKWNTTTYGSVLEYICDDTYLLEGPSTRVCRSDRKWSGSAPKCSAGCSRPPRLGVSYAITEGDLLRVGSTVTYRCRFGYTITGDAVSECLLNRTWSQPKHLCVLRNCGDPGSPVNGYIEGNEFNFGDWITYRCNQGYVIDDTRAIKRYCSSSGQWSGEPRTCSKLKCEEPKDPVNGYVEKSGISLEFQSVIRYRCNQGYRIVGRAQGECNANGNWGIMPKCMVDVNCNFDSGSYSMCGYENVGANLWERNLLQRNTRSGNPSYIIRAAGAQAILRSPEIISEESHCFKFHYLIRRIRNKESVTITSKNGERVIGRLWPGEYRHQWTSQQLTINPDRATGVVQYEVRMNDDRADVDIDDISLEIGSCESNCNPEPCMNEGVCIDRVRNFTCLCNRFYRGPLCEVEILCPPLTQLQHGRIFVTPKTEKFRPYTLVRFECNENYRLNSGPRAVLCNEDGAWSDSRKPRCTEILCPSFTPIQNGQIDMAPNSRKLWPGTVARFTCDKNYRRVGGPEEVTCNSDGAWSDHRRPRCKEILCDDVEAPTGGERTFSNRKSRLSIGSVVTFKCPTWMHINGGPKIMVCKNSGGVGMWSSDRRPICKKKYTPRSTTECPKKFTLFNTTCYRVFAVTKQFEDAASMCAAHDTNLAIIRSKQERSRVDRLISTRKFYYVGATDAGSKQIMWSNAEKLVKISSETYVGVKKRNDISTPSRCVAMVRHKQDKQKRILFQSLKCGLPLSFICQTFALRVQPVTLNVQPPTRLSVDGVYRPLAGVTYSGSPVYEQSPSGRHLYHTTEGWEIGSFNVKYTTHNPEKTTLQTTTNASLPHEIAEPWFAGAELKRHFTDETIVYITIFDRWGEWNNWSRCSTTCGSGSRSRSRKCLEGVRSNGFGDCPGSHEQQESCNVKVCIKTEWGEWTSWGECSRTCGGGERSKSRECVRDIDGEEFCEGKEQMKETCSVQDCNSAIYNWTRLPSSQYEYTVFYSSETEQNWQIECGNENGVLASIATSAEAEFVRQMLGDAHCNSDSAYTEWRIRFEFENTNNGSSNNTEQGFTDDVSQSHNASDNSSKGYKNEQCYYIHHSCDNKTLVLSIANCSENLSNGILCQRDIQCPPVDPPSYGLMTKSVPNRFFGLRSVVSFSCGEGFFLQSGPSSITCEQDGQWSSTERPVCVGEFSPWTSWSSCSATCDGVRTKTRKCLRENNATTQINRGCEGPVIFYGQCGERECPIDIQCPPVGPPSNGVMTKTPPTPYFAPESVVAFSCNKSFFLQSGPSSITCEQNGQWNSTEKTVCAYEFSPWTSWSRCTATCDGVRNRARKCLRENDAKTEINVGCNGPVKLNEKCGKSVCPTETGCQAGNLCTPRDINFDINLPIVSEVLQSFRDVFGKRR